MPSSTRARCWEALVDPLVARLGEVLWIVDLNRQSLDRVVPDITADRLRRMFEAAGWHVIDGQVRAAARRAVRAPRRRGAARPHRRDAQRGVPAPAARRRRRAARAAAGRRRRARRRRPRGRRAARRRAAAPRSATSAATTSPRCSTPTSGRRGHRPALGRVRLHDQGLGAADRGPPEQPLRPADRGADAGAGGRARRRRRRPVARASPDRAAPRRELCAATARAAAARAVRAGGPAVAAGRAGPRRTAGRASTQQALGRFFADLDARRAGGRRRAS